MGGGRWKVSESPGGGQQSQEDEGPRGVRLESQNDCIDKIVGQGGAVGKKVRRGKAMRCRRQGSAAVHVSVHVAPKITGSKKRMAVRSSRADSRSTQVVQVRTCAGDGPGCDVNEALKDSWTTV